LEGLRQLRFAPDPDLWLVGRVAFTSKGWVLLLFFSLVVYLLVFLVWFGGSQASCCVQWWEFWVFEGCLCWWLWWWQWVW
jgi:hypothetical protein